MCGVKCLRDLELSQKIARSLNVVPIALKLSDQLFLPDDVPFAFDNGILGSNNPQAASARHIDAAPHAQTNSAA